MRILAISYMLPPMLYPQAIQVGRLLSHSQHDVIAVSGESNQNTKAESGLGARVQHIAVPFKNEPKGKLHSLGLRFLPFYGAVPDIYRPWTDAAYDLVRGLCCGNLSAPDLVVTFGEPMSDHLLGLRLKKEFGIPWIAHFSDPWSDNPFRNIQPLSKLANRRLERDVVRAADAIVFTSQETADLFLRSRDKKLAQRTSVLSHSFDLAAYPANSGHADVDTLVLRYIGNFYGLRSPRPLVRALDHIAKQDKSLLENIAIELVGSIPARMMRSRAWKNLPQGLLRARGSVSYAESLDLMQSSDVLLTIDAPAQTSVFFPSKLADYIGSGKRLFGIVPPGAAARIINQCGGHSISPTAVVERIAEALRLEIVAARVSKQNREFGSAYAPCAEQYDIKNVAPIFDKLCQSTAELGRRRPEMLQ